MNKTTKQKIQMILIMAIIIFSIIGINSNASVLIQPRNIEFLTDDIIQDLPFNFEGIPEEYELDIESFPSTNVEIQPRDNIDVLLEMLDDPLSEMDGAIDNLEGVLISEEFQEGLKPFIRDIEEVISDPIFRSTITWISRVILIVMSLKLIQILVLFIAQWRIYSKAGKPGWGLLLPVYKDVLMLEIAGLSPALLLTYLIFFIPIIGPFIYGITFITIRIIAAVKISKAFGQPGVFALGLIFLPTIFNSILGFGKSKYKKDNEKDEDVKVEVKEEKEKEKEEIIEAKIEDVKEEPKEEVKEKKTANKKTIEAKKTTTKKTTETKKTTTKPKETK